MRDNLLLTERDPRRRVINVSSPFLHQFALASYMVSTHTGWPKK